MKALRSLGVRNFRLYFLGQLVSASGENMQLVGVAWLVLHLSSNRGVIVGVVIAAEYLPVLLFGTWAGVVADRLDRWTVVMCTQTSMGVLAGILTGLTYAGVVQIWMVYLILALSGCADALDIPARQAFVSEMVGIADLPNAVGLNSAVFNAGRIVGPAIGGVVVLGWGTATCFLLNALSYLAAVVSLAAMRQSELRKSSRVARMRRQASEGLRYCWREADIRSTLLLLAIVGTFGINFTIILPLLAKLTFRGGPGTYSAMTSALGAGALVGALVIANRSRVTRRVILVATAAFGAATCLSAGAPSLAILYPLLALVGCCWIVLVAASNALIQLVAVPEMRGRAMSFRAIMTVGSTAIGGPIIGWVSQDFNTRWAFALGGIASLAAAAGYAVFAVRHNWGPSSVED